VPTLPLDPHERDVLLVGVNNLIDALTQLDDLHGQNHEREEELAVARSCESELRSEGHEWVLPEDLDGLGELLVGLRATAKMSLQLGTGVTWELSSEAQASRAAYTDRRLDELTVYETLLSRLGGE